MLPLLVVSCSSASGGDLEGVGPVAKSGDGPVAWSPPGDAPPEGEPEAEPETGEGPDPVEPEPEPEPEPTPQDPSPGPSTEPPPDEPPPATCTYPGGPYGVTPGSIVAPTLSWQGFVPGSSSAGGFGAEDLFDCDGSRGIHAVLISYAAGWCAACKTEASHLPQTMATWGPAGVVVVELLLETSGGSPADVSTAQQWRDMFGLHEVYVAADPGFAFESAAADALPFKVIVDPRDMTIVRAYTGDSYDYEVLALAQGNQ